MIYAILKEPTETIEYHDDRGTFNIKLDVKNQAIPKLEGAYTEHKINDDIVF